MHTSEIIIYSIFAILGAAATFYEFYDRRNGNHPFKHMH